MLRAKLEARVLGTLVGRLSEPKVIEQATQGFLEETGRLNRDRNSSQNTDRKRLKEIEIGLQDIADAMQRGGYSRTLNDRLHQLEAHRDELERRLSALPTVEIPGPPVALYRAKLARLAEALNHPEERMDAADLLGQIIQFVEIRPDLSASNRARIPVYVHINLPGLLGVSIDDRHNVTLTPFVIEV
jgi:bacterioferritin (cytochrome b1)